MNWLKRALSENGVPSSHRLCMVILLVFILNLVSCAFFTSGTLPDVPASLSDLFKWLFTVVVAGIGTGKVASVFKKEVKDEVVSLEQ